MSATPRAALVICLALVGCAKPDSKPVAASAPSGSGKRSSIAPPQALPTPRQGMVFVPTGALVVGTPRDAYPRLADEEVPGEQLIVPAFYVDVFPYPNEEGAIPLTNVSQEEANKLCSERDKRLCGELEWERACKGPDNHLYEYGDHYRPEPCGTGSQPLMRPSGIHVGCRSDFGVRDLHGGVWEWTQSPFGRGTARGLTSVRGGNAPAGELVGRCANTIGRPPDLRSASIGFRCCVGPPEVPEVELPIAHSRRLEARDRLDAKLVPLLLAAIPDDARAELARHGAIEPDRYWSWWPAGNDELTLLSACAGSGRRAACGVLVTRVLLGKPAVLTWAEGGTWTPLLHAENDPRDIWLLGGDDPGAFRRRISYVWGRVTVGQRERRPVAAKERLEQLRLEKRASDKAKTTKVEPPKKTGTAKSP